MKALPLLSCGLLPATIYSLTTTQILSSNLDSRLGPLLPRISMAANQITFHINATHTFSLSGLRKSAEFLSSLDTQLELTELRYDYIEHNDTRARERIEEILLETDGAGLAAAEVPDISPSRDLQQLMDWVLEPEGELRSLLPRVKSRLKRIEKKMPGYIGGAGEMVQNVEIMEEVVGEVWKAGVEGGGL